MGSAAGKVRRACKTKSSKGECECCQKASFRSPQASSTELPSRSPPQAVGVAAAVSSLIAVRAAPRLKELPKPEKSCLRPSKFVPAPRVKDETRGGVDRKDALDLSSEACSSFGELDANHQGHTSDQESSKTSTTLETSGDEEKLITDSSFNARVASPAPGDKKERDDVAVDFPFLFSSGGSGHSARSFVDYIMQQTFDRRNLKWFNGGLDRQKLERREQPSSIQWTDEEDIAYSESSEECEKADTEREVWFETDVEGNCGAAIPESPCPPEGIGQRLDNHPTEGQMENKETTAGVDKLNNGRNEEQEEDGKKGDNETGEPEGQTQECEQDEAAVAAARAPRLRHRAILACGIPHREQLARKAIEDNLLFVSGRGPKVNSSLSMSSVS
ncbi:hypothetical protein ERJ75_001617900 [Trypanosoma vivax]|uniref:Uncharacterized protein n=1 Tax=Trypanosoma vivax (strain Y486) TaxID=1055687 RepID=G0TTD5_TRYVY|nr:hypothetical protein TRVL_01355 [Trypanosoma vivax]KAH8605533.1 hypothetical protein ERJ75_001617900 [Trypanosoma vivax]CCC47216.1 conserved hypothetical protein [Trypanosoma vivax Y486]